MALCLSRKPGESLEIGDDIVIRVLRIKGGSRVHLQIVAPPETKILRSEVERREEGGDE